MQSMGGNELTQEYGDATMVTSVRFEWIVPISREIVLNFVA